MKIKMLTTSAGPEGGWAQGEVRDVGKAEAEALISQGYAEPVLDEEAKEEIKEAFSEDKQEEEEAVEPPAETTATKTKRGSAKSKKKK